MSFKKIREKNPKACKELGKDPLVVEIEGLLDDYKKILELSPPTTAQNEQLMSLRMQHETLREACEKKHQQEFLQMAKVFITKQIQVMKSLKGKGFIAVGKNYG